MLQRACGLGEEDTPYQEGTLVCHLRSFMEEVAGRERYVADSPSTNQHAAPFPSGTYKRNDRATPELHRSITSPEMQLLQIARLSHRVTNNLLGRSDGPWGRAGVPNLTAPDPTCQPMNRASSPTANNRTYWHRYSGSLNIARQ